MSLEETEEDQRQNSHIIDSKEAGSGNILKQHKPKEETETARNTRLNAKLYHQSDDSIQLYKQQNNSTDLLGRLYYDDYDSSNSNILSPDLLSPVTSNNGTPMLSPTVSDNENDFYFGSPLTTGTNAIKIPNSSSSSSSLTLNNQDSTSQTTTSTNSTKKIRPNISRGISFDTTPHGTKKSLTLKFKYPNFKFRRNNKTWLVGFNNDLESTKAIEWLFDEMIINGDTIIVLQVIDEKNKNQQIIDKNQANVNLKNFEDLNVHFKKISLIFEIVIGKPMKLLKNAIAEYSPSMMVIGTHHYNENDSNHHHGISFLSKASISKHFLECALIPVIIVKPSYNYIEILKNPIDSEDYFINWIKKIPMDESPFKREKIKKSNSTTGGSASGFLSPSISRNSSYTNLINEERGRTNNSHSQDPQFLRLTNESRSRSTSKTRSFSKLFRRHHHDE
ncbi:uncharacterized protein KGF55_002204 [Candida pseudojiufengensis]|uniref:uncharacterized protein n=1 Tax=Candida pseudojiufengensis TaxID=497109 RepID=UPI0022249F9D|nr:uncharacterized protein KGF55_002204 [Candida pseudojiufengensis]KAI5964262.1 hypothetical protein KGF55_002204 [Candida pseudojiufengensis]